jgi:hypothetical protein
MKKLKLKERSNNLPEVVQLDTGAGIWVKIWLPSYFSLQTLVSMELGKQLKVGRNWVIMKVYNWWIIWKWAQNWGI